jgi:hypothetical protein
VLGDAALMGAMPKAAHCGGRAGQGLRRGDRRRLAGREARSRRSTTVCYSLAGRDWGFVETNRYQPDKGLLTAVPGAAKTSRSRPCRHARRRGG